MIDSYGFFDPAVLTGILSQPSIHAACGALETGCQQSYPQISGMTWQGGAESSARRSIAPVRQHPGTLAKKKSSHLVGGHRESPSKPSSRREIAGVVHTGSASLKNSIALFLGRHFILAATQVVDSYGYPSIALLAGNLPEARFFKGWRAARRGYQQSYPQKF
ncbi:hypothetical protein [Acidovorax sp. CF316]|uniref:hypothetical protein n=1 Tax=Acidovorax sp. CF316 TaxID=1144317 RepID=UPI0011B28219|nr:hypothetical protein [Acidovorax sp. CF316]